MEHSTETPAAAIPEEGESAAATSESLNAQERDIDSIHILPLAIIPLQTRALSSARLIKNVRLESVVEVFNDSKTGSGQFQIDELEREYDWPLEADFPDRNIFYALGRLSSYDVFTLRIALRKLGIPLKQAEALQLSEQKKIELATYMMTFTQPLIREIYGEQSFGDGDADDLISLFRDPDVQRARERLQTMATRLELEVEAVPRFLEDYGDIFMSLSYFRQCLDRIAPTISEFNDSLSILRDNWQMRNDQRLMFTCAEIEGALNDSMAAITGRFESFDRASKEMWDNLTAERFRKVETLIHSYHTTIGGVLCALTIKMNAFKRIFPEADTISPVRLAEFIMSDLRQGMDNIQAIEASAPVMSELG